MTKRKTNCDCIDKVNANLAEYNGALETNMLADPPRALISVYKVSPRSRIKPPHVEATCCPFCGAAYQSKTPRNNVREIASLQITPHPDPTRVR
jgi:hypothetical protein